MSKIVLCDPKYAHNVGGILRIASCYGSDEVVFNGDRVARDIMEQKRIPREERLKGYRDVALTHMCDPLAYLKGKGTPVAVELRPNAEDLFDFEHPDDAIYVFGPEDGTLGGSVLSRCHRFVVIPTRHCLNLAQAVATIHYDRAFKHWIATGERPTCKEMEPVSDEDNVRVFVEAMARKLAGVK